MFLTTADEIVSLVNQMRPNELDEVTLYFWLAHVEYSVLQELFDGDNSYSKEGYMTLGFPYNDVYWTYMLSMVDLALGNLESYKYTHAMAQKAWERLIRSYDVERHKQEFRC